MAARTMKGLLSKSIVALTVFVLSAALFVLSGGIGFSAAKKTIQFYTYERHNFKYWQRMVKEFNKRNPDVEVKATSVVAGNYPEVVGLMFNVGTPPDIFMGGGLPIVDLIKNDRFRPLEELAPDKKTFEAWKAKFPDDLKPWVEGTNVFDGKVYSFAWEGDTAYLVTYYMKAGLDPARGPVTWAELRDYARKITTAGKGAFYGVTMGIKRPEVWDYQLQLAIASGWTGFDWRVGRWTFDTPVMREFIQLFRNMKADGSIFPGELSNDEPEMKMNFALDRGGFYFGGPWDITVFPGYNPKVDFDFVLPPTQTGRMGGYYGRGPLAQGRYFVSRATKHPDVVWRFIEFITSEEFWEGYIKAGYGVSPFPQYNKPENFENPLLAKLVKLGPVKKIGPEQYFSPQVAEAWRKIGEVIDPVHPTLHETLQGIFMDKATLKDLADTERRQNTAWDKALAIVQSQGYKVTRANYTFADWNPLEDYEAKKK